MKLSVKLGIGFAILVLIIAITGAAGVFGTKQISTYMSGYVKWSRIDEKLNKTIIQPITLIKSKISSLGKNPSKEEIDQTAELIKKSTDDVNAWSQLISGITVLEDFKSNLENQLKTNSKELAELDSLIQTSKEDFTKWHNQTNLLESTTKKLISYAQDMSNEETDMSKLAGWGNLETTFQSNTLSHILKLRIAMKEFSTTNKNVSFVKFRSTAKNISKTISLDFISELDDSETNSSIVKMNGVINTSLQIGNSLKDQISVITKLNNKLDSSFDSILSSLAQTASKNIEPAMSAALQESNEVQSLILKIVMIVTTVGVIIGTILASIFIRIITKPIISAITAMDEGIVHVSSTSHQAAGFSQSLADGAIKQAASLEETSSTMEEMSSMTKMNADNAGQADNLMKETLLAITSADTSMGDMSSSMTEISAASEETSKIIKTIDEIAFQTNLLALNAAVEAARAGEAGAGFAVVADEVRSLAMRAADAARETSGLIEATVKKVNKGRDLVDKTNKAFKEVADNSNKVGGLVGEIATASSEQAIAFAQVSQAITQMDSITQSNSASAEESAATSDQLSIQAESMMQVVKNLRMVIEGRDHDNNSKAIAKKSTSRPVKSAARPDSRQISHQAPPHQNAKSIDPEKVFPMDDDGDFGEFKDF